MRPFQNSKPCDLLVSTLRGPRLLIWATKTQRCNVDSKPWFLGSGLFKSAKLESQPLTSYSCSRSQGLPTFFLKPFVGESSTGLCLEVFNTSVLLSQAPGSANVTYCNTHILLPLHRWLISWPFPNADSLQQTALSYRNTHLLILLTSIKSWL